jgi:hypothetical protein
VTPAHEEEQEEGNEEEEMIYTVSVSFLTFKHNVDQEGTSMQVFVIAHGTKPMLVPLSTLIANTPADERTRDRNTFLPCTTMAKGEFAIKVEV